MRNLRLAAICEYVKRRGTASMQELREHCHASPATVYRDVNDLANRGALRKIWGGVARIEASHNVAAANSYAERINYQCGAKEEIAAKTVKLINEGDIIFLDSSTTVFWLVKELRRANLSNLTIVTNSVSIISEFNHFPPHYILISLGGSYDWQLNAFLGQSTIRELENLSISKSFVSAFGIADDAVTTNHENHCALLSKIIATAEENYLLADRSKYKRRGLFRFAAPAVFTSIITN